MDRAAKGLFSFQHLGVCALGALLLCMVALLAKLAIDRLYTGSEDWRDLMLASASRTDAKAVRPLCPRTIADLRFCRWPGLFDFIVSGGLEQGSTAWRGLIKEADEEAFLTEAFLWTRARKIDPIFYAEFRDIGCSRPNVQTTSEDRTSPAPWRIVGCPRPQAHSV
jgi:hypothetical protein